MKPDAIFYKAILFLGVFSCLNCALLFAEPAGEARDDWFVIKSGSFTVYCGRNVDLEDVADKLGRRGLFVSGVYDPNPAGAPGEKIAYRLSRILKRVKDILDMYPDVGGLKIRIFKDRDELSAEYSRIFNTPADYKAFYVNQHETIYISEEDISDSVIAHEMGHAVVDHYFSVIPPERVRELLASYVDLHLAED